MSRDLALIVLAGVLATVAMVCATVIVVATDADPVAGFGLLTAGVGIGGVAIGRLSGAPATPPPT